MTAVPFPRSYQPVDDLEWWTASRSAAYRVPRTTRRDFPKIQTFLTKNYSRSEIPNLDLANSIRRSVRSCLKDPIKPRSIDQAAGSIICNVLDWFSIPSVPSVHSCWKHSIAISLIIRLMVSKLFAIRRIAVLSMPSSNHQRVPLFVLPYLDCLDCQSLERLSSAFINELRSTKPRVRSILFHRFILNRFQIANQLD